MARTKISEFSATPGNNTDIDSINIAEGCAPSGINDAIRELMAQLKDFQTGAVGDSFNGPVGTTTAAAGAFTTLAASGAVTLSGGTANGVPYLNGSKVLTSGSALVFDGSNLGLGVTPSAWFASSKAFQIGTPLALEAISNASVLFNNTYRNTAGSLRYSTSAASGFYAIDGNVHTWNTAPSGTAGNAITFTQAMTLDASGNLGVGITSSSIKLDVIASGSGSGKCVFRALADNGQILLGNAGTFDSYLDSNQWIFRTSPQNGQVERARIDSSGNLLVGTTSLPNGTQNAAALRGAADACLFLSRNATASATQAVFYNPNGVVGQISTSGSSTSYATSSDYRLKDTIAPMIGALEKVALLKPCTYKWKADGSDGQGFIAHELAEVCPEAVTGDKDATRTEQYEISPAIPATYDEEGNELTAAIEAVMGEREVPQYQGIDVSFLVGTLTAAIQELNAKFEAYKASHP